MDRPLPPEVLRQIEFQLSLLRVVSPGEPVRQAKELEQWLADGRWTPTTR